MTLSPARIEELRRLEAMATKGEWSPLPSGILSGPTWIFCNTPMGPRGRIVTDENVNFVCALHNAAPELLAAADEASRLRALLAEARPWVEEGALIHEGPGGPTILERIDRALASPTTAKGD